LVKNLAPFLLGFFHSKQKLKVSRQNFDEIFDAGPVGYDIIKHFAAFC